MWAADDISVQGKELTKAQSVAQNSAIGSSARPA